MDTLILHCDDGTDDHIKVANGFVSRCVSAVHAENHADARRLAVILNDFFMHSGENALAAVDSAIALSTAHARYNRAGPAGPGAGDVLDHILRRARSE